MLDAVYLATLIDHVPCPVAALQRPIRQACQAVQFVQPRKNVSSLARHVLQGTVCEGLRAALQPRFARARGRDILDHLGMLLLDCQSATQTRRGLAPALLPSETQGETLPNRGLMDAFVPRDEVLFQCLSERTSEYILIDLKRWTQILRRVNELKGLVQSSVIRTADVAGSSVSCAERPSVTLRPCMSLALRTRSRAFSRSRSRLLQPSVHVCWPAYTTHL